MILKSLLQHHSSNTSILSRSGFFIMQLSHPYMTTRKTIAFTIWTFVSKVMFLCFNTLSGFVIALLPRSKHLLFHGCNHHLQWFWSPPKTKSVMVSLVSPSIYHEVVEPDAMIFIFFLMLSFKSAFSLSSFTFTKRLLSSSSLSVIRVVSSAYLRLLIFILAILIMAYASSSQAFNMMYSAYKLNKQGNNIQPVHTYFLVWSQCVFQVQL